MCGICGIVDYRINSPVEETVLKKMCTAMIHRGPDDEGIFIKNGIPSIGLGHRRLSIIDLSRAGHQPMSNEDGRIWLVFNGEIYNYKELRSRLVDKGHIFKSNADSETIIHLYEDYGKDCVKYLRGFFAFAVWDETKKLLLLARDRVGKKPLIYYHDEKNFCFASEFLALFASTLVKKEINYEAIHYYLTFGYIAAPLTIYKNVFKLPPAHLLILKERTIKLERYWQLDYSNKLNISEGDAAEEILKLIKEAVKIRLYSDVPLGAFLSGGIDSSTVVALMSQLSGAKVKTFSIGFKEQDYSELEYARTIAKKFNTEHNEFIVEPKALEILPLLVEHYGEPYADSSCIPTYYVAKETRKYVTVALNGDGGDELFAGYERYQAMLASEIYQKIPNFTKNIISNLFCSLPDSINSKNRLRKIRRFFEAVNLSRNQRYFRWVGVFSDDLRDSLYSEDFKKKVQGNDPLNLLLPYLNHPNGLELLNRLLMTDTNTYLPNDLLVKVDIASMANSLEGRSPFLDHKLMEFVARLPAEYKMKRFIKKYILKKAIKGLVPEKNVNRRKMGFGVPVGEWFRGDLKALLFETILSDKFFNRRYFNSEAIRNMVYKHINGQKDYALQIWALLMLELWHRRFID
jgi:asparagine synthase (glutamine-hydrolysing)